MAEGYSGDEKYKLDKDVNTQKPVVFGTTIDKFYSIVSWVDGIPVMDMIKRTFQKIIIHLERKLAGNF